MAKVHTIYGGRVARNKVPRNNDLIETLKELQSRAKDGSMAGIIYVELSPSGRAITGWSGLQTVPNCMVSWVGALELLKHALIADADVEED